MSPTPKTVALIEDNADNRLLVQILLNKTYRVVEFEDGASALAALRDDPPDLVLLDISLPGMDGPEVLQRLRAEPRLASIPVVALTAHAMSDDRHNYLQLGFDDYVSKPITNEVAFRRVLEKHLNDS